jgi:hypothetical protein
MSKITEPPKNGLMKQYPAIGKSAKKKSTSKSVGEVKPISAMTAAMGERMHS